MLDADVVNKIFLKMPHQRPCQYLFFFYKKIKHHNTLELRSGFILNINSREQKHKNTQTENTTKTLKKNQNQNIIFFFLTLWATTAKNMAFALAFYSTFVIFRVRLDWTYCCWNWKLKTENRKHCSKIILKCVNSTVRSSFKDFFFTE